MSDIISLTILLVITMALPFLSHYLKKHKLITLFSSLGLIFYMLYFISIIGYAENLISKSYQHNLYLLTKVSTYLGIIGIIIDTLIKKFFRSKKEKEIQMQIQMQMQMQMQTQNMFNEGIHFWEQYEEVSKEQKMS